MHRKKVELCQKLISIINESVETIWYYRQQYYCKASEGLQRITVLVQESLHSIIELASEQLVYDMGVNLLLEAQEKGDEVLISDILEGKIVPCLENIVQNIEAEVPIEEFDYWEYNKLKMYNYDPDIISMIEKSSGYYDCAYEVEYTSSGQITIRMEEKGRVYYISGNNNPYKDAIFFVHGNMEQDKDQYILMGAGMLYEAEILLRHRPDANVLVIEEDPYLLKLALTFRNQEYVLTNDRFTLKCMEYLKYMDCVDAERDCLLIRKPSLKHMRNLQCKDALETYFLRLMTIKEQAFVLEKEFQKTMKCIKSIHSVDECIDNFKGKTMYLVAGGPSLDLTIDRLKDRGEESLILCVGTAAAKLKNEGIEPEYVIITDVSDAMYDMISGEVNEKKTKLLYLISANSKAVIDFKGEKYAIFQKGFGMAEEYAHNNGYTLVETGGSVSTTALDIGIRFGCKKIICMGLDLAYTNNLTHASGTRRCRNIALDDNLLSVQSVSKKTVWTTANLNSYRKWIENRIRGEKNTKFENISDGAYIEGMTNRTTMEG